MTLEAMAASKAVVTTRDAGGPSELVEHGRSGYITQPEPEAIAAHVERLCSDRRLARTMGARGRARATAVTWERVGAASLDGIAP